MDDYVVNMARSAEQRKQKSTKKLNKEARAKKRDTHPRYFKHEEAPAWEEVWEFPQYESCEPADARDYYFYEGWHACGECHWCCPETERMYFTGFEELTLNFTKTR